MQTAEYLDALRARHSIPSEAALERFLGVSKASRKNYRQCRTAFDDETALRVAELLELPPGQVLADMQAQRSKSDALRAIWTDAAARLSVCYVNSSETRHLD